MKFLARHQIKPQQKVDLSEISTNEDGGLSHEETRIKIEKYRSELIELHEMLYAEKKHTLLVVLQVMDTGGKDSTIQKIFSGVNPQSCIGRSFKPLFYQTCPLVYYPCRKTLVS